MREWLWSPPGQIVQRILVTIIGIAIAAHYTDHVQIKARTWAFALLALVVIGIVSGVTTLLARRSSPRAEPNPAVEPTAEPELDARHQAYAEHVTGRVK